MPPLRGKSSTLFDEHGLYRPAGGIADPLIATAVEAGQPVREIPINDPVYRKLLGTCRRRRELLVRALFYLEHPGPHDLERRVAIADAIRTEVAE